MNYAEFYRDLARSILERELKPQEGSDLTQIEAAERDLGFPLPLALREYYRVAGRAKGMNDNHDQLIPLHELEFEDDFLMFMTDHQNIAFWGIKVSDKSDNPLVWQAVNEEPLRWFADGWYERELSVSQFFRARFSWVFGLDDEP